MKITIILPSEAPLEVSEKMGLLSRWQFYFMRFANHYDLEVYSCDSKNFSKKLKLKHHPLPFTIKFMPYGNQILYNIYLLLMVKKMTTVLRIFSSSYFILPLIKLFKKKIIMSYHYDYITTTTKDFGGVKGITAKVREWTSIISSDILITTTEELRRMIRARYSKESIVIPNFVDLSKFLPGQKENIILYAGRIYWYKGIDYLIEAFAKISKRYPEYKLILVGLGDNDTYSMKASKLGVVNIEFKGALDYEKMPTLMGRAKIFVLPTVNREGNPKALVEAMACGCVCVATDVHGNKSLIGNDESGLLVKPQDSNSIYEAIIKVLEDIKLSTKLSKNARKSAMKYALKNTLYKELRLINKAYRQTLPGGENE